MSNVYTLPRNSMIDMVCPYCARSNYGILVSEFHVEPKIHSADFKCLTFGCEYVVGLLVIFPQDHNWDGDDED